MSDCIFCKIVDKKIPAKIVYEDDKIMAFEDLNPVGPVHVLIIPKLHIKSLNEVSEENQELISHLMVKVKEIAEKMNVFEDGYRLVANCGELGGQDVGHLHFHLISGRQMQWPPG